MTTLARVALAQPLRAVAAAATAAIEKNMVSSEDLFRLRNRC